MSDSGGSPFEEPDFSQLSTEEEMSDEDEGLEDEDLEDEELEDEELEGTEEEPATEANGSEQARAAAVLEHLAKSIVDEKDAVVIETRRERGQLRLYLHVAPSDMGRIIGRRGRTAQAVRTVVRAAAATENDDVFVEIVD